MSNTPENNVYQQSFHVSREMREKMNGHKGHVVWVTGLSGSGKSTLASAIEQKLFENGVHTYTLDGDNIRMGINKNLGFDRESRQENIRRIAEIAKLNCDAGLVVICCFISPLIADREMARSIIGEKDFSLVFVDCPIEICIERDVKGLYKRAIAGEIPNFTGISAPYEAPEKPDYKVDTSECRLNDCTDEIFEFVYQKIK